MLSLKTIPGSGGEEREREQESPKGGGGLLAGPDRKLDGCVPICEILIQHGIDTTLEIRLHVVYGY